MKSMTIWVISFLAVGGCHASEAPTVSVAQPTGTVESATVTPAIVRLHDIHLAAQPTQQTAAVQQQTQEPMQVTSIAPVPPQPTEDEAALQALRDLGIPPQTILEMVRSELRSRIIANGESAPAVSEQVPAIQATTTTQPEQKTQDQQPVQPPAPEPQQPAVTSQQPVITVSSPEVRTVNDFYTPLSAYGVWFSMSPYGQVWQPSATVIDTSWRPYVHAGSWQWTDEGWYWQSSYSWGWAPFHYGRWVFTQSYRWVWVPGTLWAPSWVQWRYSDSHIGWAPLPPEAEYQIGLGFRYHGRYVDRDCNFGLSDRHYAFVPTHGFHERDLSRVCAPGDRSPDLYGNTILVQHTHTTRDNLALSSLPHAVVSNTGRRSANAQSIVRRNFTGNTGGGPAVSVISAVPAPRSSGPVPVPSGGRNTTVTRVHQQQHVVSPVATAGTVQQPATAVKAPNYWPMISSDRRTSAIQNILRRSVVNNSTAPAATVVRKESTVPAGASAVSGAHAATQPRFTVPGVVQMGTPAHDTKPAVANQHPSPTASTSNGSRSSRLQNSFKKNIGE